jgi:arginyl-tRNA synthetase
MVKLKIYKSIISVLDELDFKYNDSFSIEFPNNKKFGDYSSNVAMVNAKNSKMNPRKLAEEIKKHLSKNDIFLDISIAGPGFLNFKISHHLFRKALYDIEKQKENFGRSDFGKGKKILIEFISANPTGPLNVVSARAASYGDTLYRIMEYTGFKPLREFYINDAGNQVDILAESLELRYREKLGESIGEFPLDAYHGDYLKDLAQELVDTEGSKLIHFSEKGRLEKLKNFALSRMHEMQTQSLENFGVNIDSWISEKTLRKQGIVEEVMSYLTEANVTYEKDEAIWFESSKMGDEKDRVLMKADGTFTYFVPDIGYHITKFQRGFEKLIDVLGPDHHGYIARLRASIEALNYDSSKLEVVILQQVNLFEKGEQVKMSKRSGKFITMDELIADVGKDAARYFFISRKSSSHLNFDLELARKKSAENPVYYIQYAYARISSILKKAKKNKIKTGKISLSILAKLDNNDEIDLIKKLLALPNLLNSISESLEPSRLATYVYELASDFHKYYQKYPIVDLNDLDTSKSRLAFITIIQRVIKICLNLMAISTPEKM